eukprot:CAMPEP_0194317884 /NCGR_PEP_ID=MMETSP0171-20130528/14572_1 /TAXON_ID=218684 /ORGANISM="Corethron pennatum, Strain L29A3" /LENGTH=220 /DNA_ID=CAMNT_0039074611 /DNA_START=47 /DNA_END=709 /DNA_ORIENTATION=-
MIVSSLMLAALSLMSLPMHSYAKQRVDFPRLPISAQPSSAFIGPRSIACSLPIHAMFSNKGSNGDDKRPDGEAEVPGSASKGTVNPLRLAVLKLGVTELRYTSGLNYETRPGSYVCAGCSADLFSSNGKYESGSGWPSFWRTSEGNISLKREWDGRVECRCALCDGHLGHVFVDGPGKNSIDVNGGGDDVPDSDCKVPGGQRMPRYCINGLALQFSPEES